MFILCIDLRDLLRNRGEGVPIYGSAAIIPPYCTKKHTGTR